MERATIDTGYVVTLDEDEKYLLLNKIQKKGKNYYLAIGVKEDDTVDKDDIAYFEEIKENDETYLEEVVDEKFLDELSDTSIINSIKEIKNIKKILEDYYKQDKNS